MTTTKTTPKGAGTTLSLDPHQIKLRAFQPRRTFDQAAMAELEESIREEGVKMPLGVRALGKGEYELIYGERRLRAAKQAGLSAVPCVLVEAGNWLGIWGQQIAENIGRSDLAPLEDAWALTIKFLGMQIEALEQEQGVRPAETEALVAAAASSPDLIEVLSKRVAALAGVETLEVYLASGKVRVGWQKVMQSVGRGDWSEDRRKKFLAPVKQLPKAVQELLADTGVSTRTMSALAKSGLDEEGQIAAVEAAHAASGESGVDVGDALREALERPAPVDPAPAPSGAVSAGDFAILDEEQGADDLTGAMERGERAEVSEAGRAMRQAMDEAPPEGFIKDTGTAAKMRTEGPEPERGSVPPAGHGRWGRSEVGDLVAHLEDVLALFDTQGPAAFTEEQVPAISVLWNEVVEKMSRAGVAVPEFA
jgi:ParB/RepB/Spo0J family partition protein